MKERCGFNPKRRIAPIGQWTAENLGRMARRIRYGGNSEHKSRPNDYALLPLSNPRPGKTLCDATGEFPKGRAEELLRAGLLKGMVSVQVRGDWPQNIWSVYQNEAFEAQLENKEQGVYHGYPMPLADDLRAIVLKEWVRREG
jgi:hypothetical protein